MKRPARLKEKEIVGRGGAERDTDRQRQKDGEVYYVHIIEIGTAITTNESKNMKTNI